MDEKPKSKEEIQNVVVQLFRQQLKGINLEDVKVFDALPEPDKKEFCRFCYALSQSPYLSQMAAALTQAQIEYSVQFAENYDLVTFGRATVNGVSLFEELIVKYAHLYETDYLGQQEDFDEHSMIGDITPVDE